MDNFSNKSITNYTANTSTQEPDSLNVLIPQEREHNVSGPLEFAQSNVEKSDSGRVMSNSRMSDIVGHPEADMTKQVSRWFPVGKYVWDTTQNRGTLVGTVTSDQMFEAAAAFNCVAQYYMLWRVSPVLKITISGNAAQVGQLVIIYQPPGVPDDCVDFRYPGLYSHTFLRPNDNTGCEVVGNYVKHLRADNSTIGRSVGVFKIYVLNGLIAPASVPASVTLAAYIKFDKVSLRVYKPPPTVSLIDEFKMKIAKLSDTDKQAFLKLIGQQAGIEDIASGISSVTSVLGDVLPLLGLFHSPPREASTQWAIGDRPQTVARMQYSHKMLCAPDQSVSQMGSLYKLMDVVSLLKIGCVVQNISWIDAATSGTMLVNFPASPFFHLWNSESIVSDHMTPAYWRGEITYRFQFVKSVFHKGQVLIQVLPQGALPTDLNAGAGISDIVDISDKSVHEITVPWSYNTDFLRYHDKTTPLGVSVSVLNHLQSTNTTTQLDINVWMSVGADFQLIGGPTQLQIDPNLITYGTVAQQAGEDEPIATESLGTPPTIDTQQETELIVPQDEKSQDHLPTNTINPKMTVPLFKTTAKPQSGWTPQHESSMKLHQHRPAFMGAFNFRTCPTSTETNPTYWQVFVANQADLLRILPASQHYAFVSGSIRLTWMTTATALTPVIMRVVVSLSEEAGTTGSTRYMEFNLSDHKTGSIEVPYYQLTPAVPVYPNATLTKEHEEQSQLIGIAFIVDTGAKDYDPTLVVELWVHAGDDYACQQPVAKKTVSALPVLIDAIEIGAPVINVGMQMPTPPPAVPAKQAGQEEEVHIYPTYRFNPAGKVPDPPPQPVFRPRSRQGLETTMGLTYMKQKICGCDTRVQIVGDSQPRNIKTKHLQKIQLTEQQWKGEEEWVHLHTETYCIHAPVLGQQPQIVQARCRKIIKEHVKANPDKVVRLPFHPTRNHLIVSDKVRVKKHKDGVKYFTMLGDVLFTVQTAHHMEHYGVWGALDNYVAQQASIWEDVKTLFTKGPSYMAQRTMKTAANDTVNDLLRSFKGKAALALGYDSTTELETLGTIVVIKAAAYATQIAAAKTPLAWTSVMLHLLADVQSCCRGVNLLTRSITQISDFVPTISNIMHRRDATFDKGIGVQAGEDDDEEPPELEGWMAGLYGIFKKIGKIIYSVKIPGITQFVKAMKMAGLLGATVRGIQACIAGIKALFTWLGFMSDPVKEKLEQLKMFMSRESTARSFAAMPVLLEMNPHTFQDNIVLLQEVRTCARTFCQYAKGLNDQTVVSNVELCNQFLRATQTVANITDAVKDFEPVFVLFEGDPGSGKTLASELAAKSFNKAFGRAPGSYYATQVDTDFFTGYSDQPVMILDDLFQDPKGERVFFLTQLVSSMKTPLPQADVESKGCQSAARIVIATTNATQIKHEWLTKPDALIRRFKDTSYQVKKGKFYKIDYTVPQGNTSYQKSVSTYELSQEAVIKQIWNVYLEKWKVHEDLKAQPLIDLTQAVGTARCPDPISNSKPIEMPKVIVRKRRVDWKTDEVFRKLTETWEGDIADNFRDEYLDSTTQHPLQAVIREDYLQGQGSLMPDVQYALYAAYHMPWLGVFEVIYTDGAQRYMDADLNIVIEGSVKRVKLSAPITKVREELSKLDDVRLAAYLRHLHYNGVSEDMINDYTPFTTTMAGVADKMIDSLNTWKWILVGTTTLITMLLSGYLISRAFTPELAETAGTYNPVNKKAIIARALNYSKALKGARPSLGKQAGAEDKEPRIKKSIVTFVREASEFRGRMEVNGVLLGGGYLLTVAHAVVPGFQHTIYYVNGAGETMRFPLLVTSNNICSMEKLGFDLTLIYMGVAFPNTKDIRKYFISDSSLETLPGGSARMFYKHKEDFAVIDTEQTFDKHYVHNRAANTIENQSGFAVPFKGKVGCCGSLLMTMDRNRDSRLIGLANAVTENTTYFVQVTQEMIEAMIKEIQSCNIMAEAVPQDGILDIAQFSGAEEQFKGTEDLMTTALPRPENPVHRLIKENDHLPVMLNMRTTYIRNGPMDMFRETVVQKADDLDFKAEKVPAIWGKDLVEVPYRKIAGGKIPGEQFYVEQKEMNTDGLMTDFSLLATEVQFKTFFNKAELLTEDQILNGYETIEGTLKVVNQGFPTNTAIGQTCKTLGLGNKKKDLLLTTDEGKVLKPEVRQKIAEVESMLKQSKTWDRVIALSYKDELRPKDKFAEGKVRLVCIEDSIFVYLASKYFGNFFDKFRATGLVCWHTLGKDPVQIWNGLANWMPVAVCGDAKNWDMSMQGPVFEMLRQFVELFYQGTEDDKRVREQLLRQVALSITGFHGDQYLSGGMKSGMYCTTEINSLIQILITNAGNIFHFVGLGSSVTEAMELARQQRYVTNGDDNMHGTPVRGTREQYVANLKQTFANFGITYTRSDKQEGLPEYEHITEAEYLKRKWVFSEETQQYHPQISPSTIVGLLQYRKQTVSPKDNWKDALVFARQARNRRMFKLIRFIGYTLYGPEALQFDWNWAATQYAAPANDIMCMKHRKTEDEDEILLNLKYLPFAVFFDLLQNVREFEFTDKERRWLLRCYADQRMIYHDKETQLLHTGTVQMPDIALGIMSDYPFKVVEAFWDLLWVFPEMKWPTDQREKFRMVFGWACLERVFFPVRHFLTLFPAFREAAATLFNHKVECLNNTVEQLTAMLLNKTPIQVYMLMSWLFSDMEMDELTAPNRETVRRGNDDYEPALMRTYYSREEYDGIPTSHRVTAEYKEDKSTRELRECIENGNPEDAEALLEAFNSYVHRSAELESTPRRGTQAGQARFELECAYNITGSDSSSEEDEFPDNGEPDYYDEWENEVVARYEREHPEVDPDWEAECEAMYEEENALNDAAEGGV